MKTSLAAGQYRLIRWRYGNIAIDGTLLAWKQVQPLCEDERLWVEWCSGRSFDMTLSFSVVILVNRSDNACIVTSVGLVPKSNRIVSLIDEILTKNQKASYIAHVLVNGMNAFFATVTGFSITCSKCEWILFYYSVDQPWSIICLYSVLDSVGDQLVSLQYDKYKYWYRKYLKNQCKMSNQ